MNTFIIITTGLVVVSLLFLILPLVQKTSAETDDIQQDENIAIARAQMTALDRARSNNEIDQSHYEQEKLAIEQMLASNLHAAPTPVQNASSSSKYILPGLLAILLPVCTLLLYTTFGNTGAITGVHTAENVQTQQNMPSVDEMLASLQQRLKDNPKDSNGWFLLARTYMMLNQYEQAIEALETLSQLVGKNPNVLVQLADAKAMQNGGQLRGEPQALLEQALEIDDKHPQGLMLYAMSLAERGQYTAALERIKTLRVLVRDDAESVAELDQLRAQIKVLMGQENVTVEPTVPQSGLTIQVTLDEALAIDAQVTDTLFIFARQADQANAPPIAVVKKKVIDLPAEIILSDQQSMQGGKALSSYQHVQIVARISTSGQPSATTGDLFGIVENVPTDTTQPIALRIDQRVK